MDRITIDQLNRMEQKLDHVIEGQKFALNYESVDTLQGFYEQEIVAEDGKLHYLAKDNKVKEFFENLIQEEQIEEEDTEDKRDFENKPFKN